MRHRLTQALLTLFGEALIAIGEAITPDEPFEIPSNDEIDEQIETDRCNHDES